ncbi:hypothetical protein ACGFY9_39975 [Streptomyces sp. NPDC048504]|uniref:hypothetical protein n=1 Tax=Streptomyces sp. NPDC048504 TaxID=3365559 RepID=UPI003715473F
MRLRKHDSEQDLTIIEGQMRTYAEAHGLRLVDTFYEDEPGITPYRLIRRLIRDDIHHVIVPSLVQITEHPLMALLIAEAISDDAGATVYEASEAYEQVDAR